MKRAVPLLLATVCLFAGGARAQHRGPIVPRKAVAACLGEHESERGAHDVSIAVSVRVNDEGGLDLLSLTLGGETDLTVGSVAACVELAVSGGRTSLAPGTERSERWSVRLAADPNRRPPPRGREGDLCAPEFPRCVRGLQCCGRCGFPGCQGSPGVCAAECSPVP